MEITAPEKLLITNFNFEAVVWLNQVFFAESLVSADNSGSRSILCYWKPRRSDSLSAPGTKTSFHHLRLWMQVWSWDHFKVLVGKLTSNQFCFASRFNLLKAIQHTRVEYGGFICVSVISYKKFCRFTGKRFKCMRRKRVLACFCIALAILYFISARKGSFVFQKSKQIAHFDLQFCESIFLFLV
jgi:hypothetical protein